MSDLAWTIIAGIACIIVAYGLGLRMGYERGLCDEHYNNVLNDLCDHMDDDIESGRFFDE